MAKLLTQILQTRRRVYILILLLLTKGISSELRVLKYSAIVNEYVYVSYIFNPTKGSHRMSTGVSDDINLLNLSPTLAQKSIKT